MTDVQHEIQAASSTATGRRSSNQDAAVALKLSASDNLWGFQAVVGVADGMGGHAAGEVASRIAADTISEVLSLRSGDQSEIIRQLASLSPEDAVVYAVQLANQKIYQQAQTDVEQYDMGTTLTVVAFTSDTAVVAHIGDSRGYLLNSGGIHQVTQDHSWVARQVREQRMTEEEAARSPLRNQVTRTLGVKDNVVPDVVSIPLEPGSVYLVCSDGLSGALKNEEIAQVVLTTATVNESCETLVSHALESGAQDNVTVACVAYGSMPRGGMPIAQSASEQITEQLYPAARTHSTGGSPLATQRLMRLGIAAGAVLLLAAVLLLRSCLLAPERTSSQDTEIATEERPSKSMLQLPPIDDGLTVKVLIVEDDLVAAANRHVLITIHALELDAAASEPSTTIGPDRDYVRALSEQEIQKWADADASCQITLWAQDGHLHWRTEPGDLELYVNQKKAVSGSLKLGALGGQPVRLGFYFPANDRSGYTVALPQIDAGNLPAIDAAASAQP
jgi:serine/threonine protein phosphatase PrpC